MNAAGLAFTLVACLLIFVLPRRHALVPLLATAALMTRGQVLEIAGADFTVLRLVVGVGVLRLLLRREGPAHGVDTVDRLMFAWAGCLMATTVFHTDDQWLLRAGIVWTELGTYLLLRAFLRDWRDVRRAFALIVVLLVPVALAMVAEKLTGENAFSVLGGVDAFAAERDGKLRASGPFFHAILAGTVGAATFPMALCLWRTQRALSLLGMATALAIVLASTSSGPIMMLLFAVLGLALYRVRRHLAALRWLGLAGVLALAAVMKDPFYFVMARIDITGGSTGYHRAQLIRSSIDHLHEWWLAGTDVTRHWMPTGIFANPNHTDMTNHVLQMGVWGGLPLIAVFLLMLAAAFRQVGRALDSGPRGGGERAWLAWTLGAVLFAHLLNFMSISLFDQSIVFFYVVLASIGALRLPVAEWVEEPVRARARSREAEPVGYVSRPPFKA